MIKLTDGTKTISLTKDEMEIIETALIDIREDAESLGWKKETEEFNNILTKLEGLNYE